MGYDDGLFLSCMIVQRGKTQPIIQISVPLLVESVNLVSNFVVRESAKGKTLKLRSLAFKSKEKEPSVFEDHQDMKIVMTRHT